MKSRTGFALVLLLVGVAGCATPSSTGSQTSVPTSVRCLANPNETGGMRPLIFLLCIQTP
jgi:hypothetical protein